MRSEILEFEQEVESKYPETEFSMPGISSDNKPLVVFGFESNILNKTADTLGKLIAQTGCYYLFNGTICEPDFTTCTLRQIPGAKWPSIFSDHACLITHDSKGQLRSVTCSKYQAEIIIVSDAFQKHFPVVKNVSPTPALIEKNGDLIEQTGYIPEHQCYCFGRVTEHVISDIDEAKDMLAPLFKDFKFANETDESLAHVLLLTPQALCSNLIKGRAPLFVIEADKPGAGKGYLARVIAAANGFQFVTITSRDGGVGALDESLDSALITGQRRLCIDNVRGTVDNVGLESMLTENIRKCRALRSEATCYLDDLLVVMTSNGARLTRDLARRAVFIRLTHQPDDYAFKTFPEGDLLAHVSTHADKYRAAILCVLRAWWKYKQTQTTNAQLPSFNAWAQFACETAALLGLHDPLERYKEKQHRASTPHLSWLRLVVHELKQQGLLAQWLRCHDIYDAIEGTEAAEAIKATGVNSDQARSQSIAYIGRMFSKIFGDRDAVEIENIRCERRRGYDADNYKDYFEYKFELTAEPMA